jgi:hypothetical protein
MTNAPPSTHATSTNVFVPTYIRLPKWGQRCPYTQLTRTQLDLLTRPQAFNNFRPPVLSKRLKMTGDKSGVKLIDYQSLLAHIASAPDISSETTESAEGRQVSRAPFHCSPARRTISGDAAKGLRGA